MQSDFQNDPFNCSSMDNTLGCFGAILRAFCSICSASLSIGAQIASNNHKSSLPKSNQNQTPILAETYCNCFSIEMILGCLGAMFSAFCSVALASLCWPARRKTEANPIYESGKAGFSLIAVENASAAF